MSAPAATVTVTAAESDGTSSTISFSWLIVDPTQVDLAVTASAERSPVSPSGVARTILTVTIVNHGPRNVAHTSAQSGATVHSGRLPGLQPGRLDVRVSHGTNADAGVRATWS